MEAEIEELTNSIERQQRAERREQELSKPVNSPITGKPYKDEPQGEVKTGRASDEYKKAMLTALRSNFRQVSNVLQEGVDADGGYLVPEEYDHRLIDVLTEENIMRGIATKITTSGEHKINIAATKPAAAWIEEGGALSFGDATFDQKILDAHKLHVAIKITEELLYDNAFGLENYIITEFGKALANAEEDAFLNGDGVGKPTGIFDKTKGGESIGTLTAALKSDDVLDLNKRKTKECDLLPIRELELKGIMEQIAGCRENVERITLFDGHIDFLMKDGTVKSHIRKYSGDGFNKTPFSRKIFCGYCGSSIVRMGGNKRRTCWMCSVKKADKAGCEHELMSDGELYGAAQSILGTEENLDMEIYLQIEKTISYNDRIEFYMKEGGKKVWQRR